MKERINYWILLAQLNPVPVAIGAGILILLIALFLFQRRRAKATRHVRPSPTKASAKDIAPEAKAAAELKKEAVDPSVAATGVAAATSPKEEAREVAPVVIPAAQQSPVDDARRERVAQVSEQARNVLAGNNYDESLIGSDDRETRQLVGAELLSAIVGRNLPRRERAREAFMKHGYFDDATRDLRIADSANERAAAARRLSFVHDREATPHLIGALDDPSPDVRRAAVEALMDLRDPAAIGPLNSLMQTENDRKVPRTLIKQAIEACATSAPDESFPPPTAIAGPSSQPIESEREVIEL